MTAAGTIVGSRYRLEQLIAQGGMGEVWKASHVSLLFPVAIKFSKPSGGDERFAREARIAASLRHPNVVSVLDGGVTDDGAPFLVMEYLAGQSLAARLCAPEALSVSDLLRVVTQTLRGLETVHRAGVVHRDIKPENIFLVRHDDELDAKLLDFGVAHAHPSSAVAIPLSSLTVTGCTVGTPWYMAPEQARGLDVTAAADLFSVAVVLYRAVTGRFPFEGATLADIVLKSVTTKPTPPHVLRPDVGAQLGDIILRALAVDPAQRFPDAHSMRMALGACHVTGVYAAVLPASHAPHQASSQWVPTWSLAQVPPAVPVLDPPSEGKELQPRYRRMTLPEHDSLPSPVVASKTGKGHRMAVMVSGAVLVVLAMIGTAAWRLISSRLPPGIQIVSEELGEGPPRPMVQGVVRRASTGPKEVVQQANRRPRNSFESQKRPIFRNPGF